MSCQLEISDLESHITCKTIEFALLSTSHLLVLCTCIISGHETVEFLFQCVASLNASLLVKAPPKAQGSGMAESAFPFPAISDSLTIPSHVQTKYPVGAYNVSWMAFDA
jgi:hypothetical protein